MIVSGRWALDVFWRQVSRAVGIRISVCTSFPPGSGKFRVTVLVVVGSRRLFAALVLGAVCIDVDGQFPVLSGTLYTRISGCAPNPFVMVDDIYLASGALDALCLFFHQPSMAQTIFLCLFLRRVCGHPPRRGPGPPAMGVASLPSRLPGRRDRAIIRLMNVLKSIPDCTDRWTHLP